MLDIYQGIQDGNVESVQLPADRAFVTVEMCLENLSTIDQSILWQDVYLTSGDLEQIHPVAVGYDQADAFSWLLPIAEPAGAKSIDHKFYFFLVQSHELMRLSAGQSLGCSTSAQYKSLALLFTVPEKRSGHSYTLRFYNADIPIRARKIIVIPEAVQWGFGLGGFGLLATVGAILVGRRKRQAQAATAAEETSEAQSPPD